MSFYIEYQEALEVGNRIAFLMRPMFVDKEKRLVETLGQRLRKEGQKPRGLSQSTTEWLKLLLQGSLETFVRSLASPMTVLMLSF